MSPHPTYEYEVLTFALSAGAFTLSLFYLWRTIRSYRIYHDERAAVNLSKGVGLVVIAFGLLVSAFGLFFEHSNYSVAGLMLARGALIALLATLLLVAARPGAKED